MANFQLNNALSQEAWSSKYLREYTRKSGFLPYMRGPNAPILVNRDLTKERGDLVHIPYFRALSGAGVTGGTTLKGSEEALVNYTVDVRVDQVRNGVNIPESQAYKTDLDLANVASTALMNWSADRLVSDIVSGLGSIPVSAGTGTDGTTNPDTTKTFAASSAAEKNAWLAANLDRVVFGTAQTTPTGTFSTDAATVAAGEVLNAATVDYMVDRAVTASTFRINPFDTKDTEGREYYVLFVGSAGYNQLRNDADIKAANREAWTKNEMTNPIFQGGDLLWNGVIIRRIPSIATVGTIGTASASLHPAYLCGAGAVGVAYSAMPEARGQKDDYGEMNGVAIREVRGVKKMTASLRDLGMVTCYHASV